MEFNHKTELPEEFLLEPKNLAMKAYPTIVDKEKAPVENTVAND